MLQKLNKIKNFKLLKLIELKINIFLPKLYKIDLINFLLIIYSNQKNNIINITNPKWSVTLLYYLCTYIYVYYILIESVLRTITFLVKYLT